MAGLLEVHGADLVTALVAGGFRVHRRERGLVLLVRGRDVVVVPVDKTLGRERLRSLLARIAVGESELLGWLAATSRSSGKLGSGFHRRTDVPATKNPKGARTLAELVDAVKHAQERAAAADDDARVVLAGSRQLLEHLAAAKPDSERLRAALAALEEWDEALRVHDADERRSRSRR